MRSLVSACEGERDWLLGVITDLVSAESPSGESAALESCARVLAATLTETGASIDRLPGEAADHVRATWPGGGARVLLIGHFDTVWPIGQIRRMPLHEKDGKLFGPGILDMKAGLAIGALAIRVLTRAMPTDARPHITMLATTDEETGSRSSRAAIERLARESAAVLALEPALPGGAVKTARKGVGEFDIVAHGVSAHAGVDPGAGASAISELARVITRVEALADPSRGLTVNVGVIEGGTRSNVVAERASARIDVRVARMADAAAIEAAIAGLRPSNPRVRLEITGGVNRPPMERTAGVARLFAIAQDVAREIGQDLNEGQTGGASDGNFTAGIGVPTLDGLGALGDGPHALHEHVVINELPGRAALVAGLIARIGNMG